MTLHRSVLPAIFAAACLACVFALPARAQDATGPSRVAVVNPAFVFQQIQEPKDLRDDLDREVKELQSEAQRRAAEIENLKKDLGNFRADNPQFAAKQREYTEKAIQLRAWNEITNVEIGRKRKLQMKLLFQKFEDMVKVIATEKKFDVVLSEFRPEIPDDLEQMSFDELRARMNARNVLFKSAGVNIDDEVISRLNAAYKAAHPVIGGGK